MTTEIEVLDTLIRSMGAAKRSTISISELIVVRNKLAEKEEGLELLA